MTSYPGLLRKLLGDSTWQMLCMFALSLSSVSLDLVCMLLLPLFVLVALGAENAGNSAVPLIGHYLSGLTVGKFTLLIVMLFLFRAVFMLFMGASIAALSESVRKQVVSRLFESVLWRPYELAIAQPVSAGITAITVYTNSFSQAVVLPLMRLTVDLFTIIAMLIFVALLEPAVVVMTGSVLILVAASYYFGIRRINDHQSRRLADLDVSLTHHATQALSAPREIRIFGVQHHIQEEVTETLSGLAVVRAWLGAIYWFPRALGELTLIGLAIAYMVLKSHAGVDFALVASSLSVIAFAGLRILPAFAQSMTNVSQIRSGRVISQRLVGMLSEGRRIHDGRPANGAIVQGATTEAFVSLEVRHLSFKYAGTREPVLDGISLNIAAGESVGVIGPSGAGKSTLGDLLLGLLTPMSGEVLVNGHPTALEHPDWLERVGFVPQAPYILNDSVLRNVAYGLPESEIDRERVESCISLARLGDVVNGLQKGLDTSIGDFGVRLSGGQRQRLAIARALYWKRDFLVLDEATSALDSETEAEVIRSIDDLKGNVTTVIIAHRVSTLSNCDRVYEVRDGSVIEVGKEKLVSAH